MNEDTRFISVLNVKYKKKRKYRKGSRSMGLTAERIASMTIH